jgi:hypothetical protein
MSAERKQVLDMLAEGKISAADADRLLDKLGGSGDQGKSEAGSGASDAKGTPANPKFLRVEVDAKNGEHVNIRVPMFLLRTGIKLSTMLPSKVSSRLTERGIDLSELSRLDGPELVQALRELTVDVQANNGDKVRVFCE